MKPSPPHPVAPLMVALVLLAGASTINAAPQSAQGLHQQEGAIAVFLASGGAGENEGPERSGAASEGGEGSPEHAGGAGRDDGGSHPGQGHGPPDHAQAHGHEGRSGDSAGGDNSDDGGDAGGVDPGDGPSAANPGSSPAPVLEVNREGAANVLHWSASEGPQTVLNYVVYTYPFGGAPVPIASVNASTLDYTDPAGAAEDFYFILPMAGAQAAGPPSNAASSEWPHCAWLVLDPDTLLGVLTNPDCFLPPPQPELPVDPNEVDPLSVIPSGRLPKAPINLGVNIH